MKTMQDFESQPQEQENDKYKSLREEISVIKTTEMAKKEKGEKYNPHFETIDPQELTEVDLEVYRNFKEKMLTKENFALYQEDSRRQAQQDVFPESRREFFAWLCNKINTDYELMAQWDPKYKDFYEALAKKEKEKEIGK